MRSTKHNDIVKWFPFYQEINSNCIYEILRGYFNLNTYKLILIDYLIFTVVLLLCLLSRSRNETTCQYCNTFVSLTCEVYREVYLLQLNYMLVTYLCNIWVQQQQQKQYQTRARIKALTWKGVKLLPGRNQTTDWCAETKILWLLVFVVDV